jgi:uncharacterized membrane protein
MCRRAGILARLLPEIPEKGSSAVDTFNAALGAAAAALALGAEVFRFLGDRRDRRSQAQEEADDES